MKKFAAILAITLSSVLTAATLGASALAYTGASDWAMAELDKAESYDLIPESLQAVDISAPINRAEFAAVSVKLYEALSGEKAIEATENPFTDTEDSEVLKAYELGITSGVTVDSFEPDSLLSREQAATMLARIYKIYSGNEITNHSEKLFDDDADISRWAKDSVYFMAEHGIIQGMGNNLFAPRNLTPEQEAVFYANSTREQALVIAKRMYEKFNTEKPADPEKPTESEKPDPTDEIDYLALIPICTFGEITEEKSDEYGASITVSGVTQEDYESYVKIVEGRYPTHVNNLDGATQFVIKSDGKYNVKVSFVGETMTVSIENALKTIAFWKDI